MLSACLSKRGLPMSISKHSRFSIALVAACIPAFAAESDPQALIIYARPHVVSAQNLAAELAITGRTSCNLAFVPGSTQLDLASYAQVQEIATLLRDDAGLRIAITIHSAGADPVDSKMARQRALLLVTTLRDLDVVPRQVVAGPMSNPVAVAFNELVKRS